MVVAEAILVLLASYTFMGLLFGAAFVTCGVQRLDPAARRAPWGFRILILPGSAALWPMLLRRWWRSTRGGASS